jgi:hypothetical protein
MIDVVVNGQTVELPDEIADFPAFVREATELELAAVIARCVQLALNAGASDEEAQLVCDDVTYQIGRIRGLVMVH